MRVFLALAFVFICFSGTQAWAQASDTVTDDDVKRALHGGGAPVSSAPREYQSAPGQADEDEAVSAEETDVQVMQGEATTSAPAPAPSSSNSLMDLKAAQDDMESDENAPALQAIGEGAQAACPSREVAATVKMPDTLKMVDPDGQRTKARKCEDAFARLPDACDQDNPCSECDKAVKLYTDTCMYVENPDDMKDMLNPSVGVGYNPRGATANPVTRIPHQQSRKP